MKKLIHRKYGFSILLEENQIYEIVIENPTVLVEIVRDLLVQAQGQEGEFVLSQENNILPIEKNLAFIQDPFTLDVNQRKILTKLYSQINEYVNDILGQERTDFLQTYNQYMDKICEKSDLFLVYEEEPEFQEILKLGKMRIDVQADNIINSIVEYIKVCKELLHQEIFVFLNLKMFLAKEELEALYQECFQRKVHLLLIEAILQERIEGEKICIIDKDKCILYF